ncbi:MAG: class I SAM-dependent methyltransferase [Acholeplasma sp.]|nr:class I SAM-dependent methyltransferase [Acholeplasma sp.]
MLQKELFLNSEGDSYFQRNRTALKKEEEIHKSYKVYLKYMNPKMKILEIGCSDGRSLDYYRIEIGCFSYGIDPSEDAIKIGKELYPEIDLSLGTADNLNFPDDYFDFVIFGFCLYLVDRKLLTKVVYEADRVLKDSGYIGITDFDTNIPKKRPYKHHKDINSYKCDYSKMFLAFPHYSLIEKINMGSADDPFILDTTQRAASVILYKNHEQGYYYEPDQF